MKKTLQIFTLILVLIVTACGGLRDMQVQVKRPAIITVKSEIQSIAVLNRSIPTKKAGLEGALTGELPQQDKELSEECLRGLNDLLQTSERFKIVRCTETMNAADEKSLTFGAPLSWEMVDSICKKYGTDALMVLEFFDTDFSILNPNATAAAAIGSVVNGGSSTVSVTGKASARTGFRIYNPSSKTILYEDRFEYKKTWRQTSTNPADAIAKLVKRNPALVDVSYVTGQEFAKSIVPLYFWEARSMYKGKKGLMEKAERQALSKDWEGAARTWEDVFNSSIKSKEKGKAAFNLALANEVLGNLVEAQKWIQTSYVEDGQNTALVYSSILDARVREQAKLKEQEDNEE